MTIPNDVSRWPSYAPLVLAGVSAVLYGFITLGAIPERTDFGEIRGFQIGLDMNTSQALDLKRVTMSVHDWEDFRDGQSGVTFYLTWTSSEPVTGTFFFTAPHGVQPKEASVKEPYGPDAYTGDDTTYDLSIKSADPYGSEVPNGVKVEEKQWASIPIWLVTFPFSRPAGESFMSVGFASNLEVFKFREDWGSSTVYLSLDGGDHIVQEVLPQVGLVELSERSSKPLWAELTYTSLGPKDVVLSNPIPDADYVNPRSITWKRQISKEDDGTVSVQFGETRDRTRFAVGRLAELAVLLLGGALGVLIAPEGQRWPLIRFRSYSKRRALKADVRE